MPFDMSLLHLLLGTTLLVLIVVAMETMDRRAGRQESLKPQPPAGLDDPALPRPGKTR